MSMMIKDEMITDDDEMMIKERQTYVST